MINNYLQAPHIQLGFYWHNRPQEASFAACMRWLIADGYDVAQLEALRSVDGRLPRFRQPAWLGNPEAECAMFENWDAATALSSVDWLPILCHLSPTTPQDVPIYLNYALVFDESYDRGDAHAIEIHASGAALNLRQNVGASEMTSDDVAEAELTDAWQQRIFRAVCESLAPTYAANNWENALQPPAYLAQSGTSFDFQCFFLSQEWADVAAIETLVELLDAWTSQRFASGLLIEYAMAMDSDGSQGDRVASLLREMMRKLQVL
ncbi:MAG: hypothetical protein H6819_00270 [Phycisphaerales bacterium]|nr:hypothetical protein [Phycisphaerales bacterium]MCB9857357.1 hypothetical protein [Phycisphaerales bacterium]